MSRDGRPSKESRQSDAEHTSDAEGVEPVLETNADPLPEDLQWLQEQVERCRWMLQKEQVWLMDGPGTLLELKNPLPDGKSHTLVLDLDFTLVLSIEYKPDGSRVDQTQDRPDQPPDASIVVPKQGIDHKFDIWHRPGLRQFLEAISKRYYIVLFSAGGTVYVDKVFKTFDPDKEFISEVYSSSNMTGYLFDTDDSGNQACVRVKDISGFFRGDTARSKNKLVCVDDNIDYFILNISNVVPIRPFMGDPKDSELLKLCKFLHSLLQDDDVQQGIRLRYNLVERAGVSTSKWLSSSQTPSTDHSSEEQNSSTATASEQDEEVGTEEDASSDAETRDEPFEAIATDVDIGTNDSLEDLLKARQYVPVTIEAPEGHLLGNNFYDQPIDAEGYTDVDLEMEKA